MSEQASADQVLLVPVSIPKDGRCRQEAQGLVVYKKTVYLLQFFCDELG